MSVSVQRIGTRTRLWDVRGMMAVLDIDQEPAVALVEEGKVLFAFNIALEPERAHSTELRIIPRCVLDYKAGRRCTMKWADVMNIVLPAGQPTVTASEIARILNCSETLVYCLIRKNQLIACTEGRRGPGNSAKVFSCSLEQLLMSRRWPVPGAE